MVAFLIAAKDLVDSDPNRNFVEALEIVDNSK